MASKKKPAKKAQPTSKVVPPKPPAQVPDRKRRDNSTFYQGGPYDDKKNKLFMKIPTARGQNPEQLKKLGRFN